LACSPSVVAGNEEVDDGQKILGEFSVAARFLSIVNHDSHLKALAKAFEELEAESTKSVFVGNHNFFDSSFEDEVQKGL
jgi:hypothetical protein